MGAPALAGESSSGHSHPWSFLHDQVEGAVTELRKYCKCRMPVTQIFPRSLSKNYALKHEHVAAFCISPNCISNSVFMILLVGQWHSYHTSVVYNRELHSQQSTPVNSFHRGPLFCADCLLQGTLLPPSPLAELGARRSATMPGTRCSTAKKHMFNSRSFL